MTKLNILFLSNRNPLPIKDGHSRRTFNVLKRLSERHNVYFLSFDDDPQNCDSKILEQLNSFCWHVELIKGPSKQISVQMLVRLIGSLFSFKPYTIWRHYSIALTKRVKEIIERNKINIVHCDILPLVYLLNKFENIPCTLTDHDVCYLKSYRLAKQYSNPILKAFVYFESFKLKRLESRIFDKISLGITVSEHDRKILQALCLSGNFIVAENGVDIDEFKPRWDLMESNTILWIGGFGYMPNKEGVYYFLDKIYPIIKKNVSSIKLIIIGNNVTERLRQISLSDNSIKILGYVDDPLPFIHASTVFVAPILSGSGTRLKILEAMACGKAIVSTTLGCEGIEGVDGMHYILADEPEKFAKSVANILNDIEFRKTLGYNARKLAVEKYDWENIIDKIDCAYQKLPFR